MPIKSGTSQSEALLFRREKNLLTASSTAGSSGLYQYRAVVIANYRGVIGDYSLEGIDYR